MSDDNGGNGRKTMLPEFLPAPSAGTTLTPKERVAERARIFLQRFRGLGTTAGAAVLSLQCSGYGVVDPLPPPPQQCSSLSDPFPQIHVTGFFVTSQDGGTPQVALDVGTGSYPMYLGFRIDAVRVTGGTLLGVDDQSSAGQGGGTRFLVTVAPASTTSGFLVDIDLGCGAATATKHYRVSYYLPSSSSVTVEEIAGAMDAGSSSQ